MGYNLSRDPMSPWAQALVFHRRPDFPYGSGLPNLQLAIRIYCNTSTTSSGSKSLVFVKRCGWAPKRNTFKNPEKPYCKKPYLYSHMKLTKNTLLERGCRFTKSAWSRADGSKPGRTGCRDEPVGSKERNISGALGGSMR